MVTLPPQPPSVAAATPTPGTLVQLSVAGSTFIIPLASIERYPSHLARFATGCTTMADAVEDVMESDGTFSSVDESDRDFDPPSPQASDLSADL